MEEKDIALMLLDSISERMSEIENLLNAIEKINYDYFYYADSDEIDEAVSTLNEQIIDIKKGIKRA